MSSNLQGGDALRRRLAAIKDTRQLLGQIALLGVSEAKHIAHRDFTKTGFLEATIRVGTITESSATILAGGQKGVGYARYVEEGTGLYGPRKRKIVPKRAKVLAWRTAPSGGSLRLSGRSRVSGGKQTAGWAFARSVRGRKATPYLKPGAQKAVDKAGVEVVVKLWNEAA